MPEYGPIAQQRRPQTPPQQQQQQNAIAGGRQPTYTSFASLGAAEPLSPSSSQNGGAGSPRSALRGSLKVLRSFTATLDPRLPTTQDEDDHDTDTQHASSSALVDERTPLLTDGQRPAIRRSQKYVGGGCVCDPFELNAAGARLSAVRVPGQAEESPSCQLCITVRGQSLTDLRDDEAQRAAWPSGMDLAAISQVCYAAFSMFCAMLGDGRVSGRLAKVNALQILIWHSVMTAVVSAVVLLSVRRYDVFVGPKDALLWHWTRAVCAAITSNTFVVASQRMAMSDLVTVVYVAPTMYTIGSQLFFASRHPFRAQLAALSLWIGLILVVGPQMTSVEPKTPTISDATVAALPLDLPPLTSTAIEGIGHRWAYASGAICTISTFLSFALLERRSSSRRSISPYHTLFASSLLTAILALFLHTLLGERWCGITQLPSLKTFVLILATLFFSLAARILQEAAVIRTGVCQVALIAFLQPLLSTGLDIVLDNDLDIGDVVPIAGCLLLAVNLAWLSAPLDDD